ncbi:hypothetical protein F2Q70_00017020 [Brassica cretica]|uniref:Uncharacterized protein n=1 Tax=Brassica cretica TaxID=69181 RepID=A0A3N6QGF5_BRACR|nr:hypothetical protein F2Q70_00017020 [Brassica cretica]KAF2595967.1 hypothetical protein F2Q68_00009971 [Brassica cretica]
MPPQTKQKSFKTPKVTCENYMPTPNHSALASYPWPRADKEGKLINLDDPMLLDFNCEGWDKESAARYNTLLNTEILPTRLGHADTLVSLGHRCVRNTPRHGDCSPLLPNTRALPRPRVSDDFGAFWRYLEQAPEMTIELDHRSILKRSNRSMFMS